MLPKLSHRDFLLGILDEDAVRQLEEEILSGSVDPHQLEVVEDELIDDYLFEKLAADDERRFIAHFLSTHERKRRLAFARSLMAYAENQQDNALQWRQKRRFPFFPWKTATAIALACSLMFAVLLGFQSARLRRETLLTRNARSEIEELQTTLAAQNIRPSESAQGRSRVPAPLGSEGHPPSAAEPAAALELGPLTRGANRTMLRLSASPRLVLINLKLPGPPDGKYREVLTVNGTRLWSQEFSTNDAFPESRSTIALPASLLKPGNNYTILLQDAAPDGRFQDWETYVFSVEN